MKTATAIAFAAVASLTMSAAGGHAQDKPADKPASKNECFWSRNVTSFAAPDDHTVYIKVNLRDVYRLDLMVSCPDVDWDQRVALVSNRGAGGSICGPLDAEIVSHATGLGPQRCPVKALRKLTPEEVAALPKKAKP
ncbi:DUF6491 family protein [Phenylobacterium sp.]|jgi:hypothetical protein|uniref:DUF6491 family protein n=1 Tax=Phenylobacterium sp. TaxID=1871053 RepID=UPI00120A490E|nr:DUF6491 family protein [Phenylobacterium sp.]THD70650.1 MAG: hypothetical protein E8A12_02630 [Phenylobacterium sp.]